MLESNEIWRVIPGFENYYVSSHGRVKYGEDYILGVWYGQYDTPCMTFSEHGTSFNDAVWILVRNAFFKNFNGMEVEYIDGDRTNLRVDNLRFTLEDPKTNGRRPVVCKDVDGYRVLDRRKASPIVVVETGNMYGSALLLAKELGVRVGNVYDCFEGSGYTIRGRSFRYA